MCLSDIGRVVDVDIDRHAAQVDVEGRSVDVSTVALGLDTAPVAVGDWLVIHTGLAVGRLDDEEAERISAAREELTRPTRPTTGEEST